MRTGTVLDAIVARTREDLQRRKRELPLSALADADADAGADASGRLLRALRAPGIAVIAEFKRRSPSAGVLREQADVAAIVSAYERGGAAALSVLTEEPHFEGSLEDLRAARAACALPILRKDFIVDPYQLYEARAAGADAVLLICAVLAPRELQELREQALALGLDALVEVHDAAELAVALGAGADPIGINNRDLRDFSVDVARTSRLLAEIPAGVTVVSESGIGEAAQLAELHAQGVSAVLVGESLMRSRDPEAALRALRGLGEREPAREHTGPAR